MNQTKKNKILKRIEAKKSSILEIKVKDKDNSSITITDETKLFEDLGFDDLDLIELAMEIELDFSVSINETLLSECQTVGDIMIYLDQIL